MNQFSQNMSAAKTKKLLASAILVFLLAFNVVVPTMVYADEINVTINGEKVVFSDQGPVIVEGRVLVPIRGVFETLGYNVRWDSNEQIVTLQGGGYEVKISINKDSFNIDRLWRHGIPDDVVTVDLYSEPVARPSLEVPAQIINNRTLLPIRAILENLGYHVDWDENTRTVIISEPSNNSSNSSEFSGTFVSDYDLFRFVFHADGTWETDMGLWGLPSRFLCTGPFTFENNRVEIFVDDATIARVGEIAGVEQGSVDWYELAEAIKELLFPYPMNVFIYDAERGTLRFYEEPDEPFLTRE